MRAENYDEASKAYAAHRIAVGLDFILGAAIRVGLRPEKSSLIDLGCGAGKYALPLARHFKQVVGVDRSAGQLAEAKTAAVANSVDNVEWIQADIRDIGGTVSGSFDVALCSLVLHHLRSKDGQHFEEQKRALKEGMRLLKGQSIFVVATCSHHQVRHGAWYCEVMPEKIINLRQSYYAPFEKLDAFMIENGLVPAGRYLEIGKVLHGEQYETFENVFDPSFRKTDSIFSSLSDDDTSDFLCRVKSLKESGEIQDLLRANRAVVARQGQVTFLVYRRS